MVTGKNKPEDQSMVTIHHAAAAPFPDSASAYDSDSNPYLCSSSSPDPTQSEPTQIYMVSPPDSPDGSVQNRRLSSSSDEELKIVDLGVGCSRSKRDRVLDGAAAAEEEEDDTADLKKIRVRGKDDTQQAGNANVVVVDSGNSDSDAEEISAMNLGAAAADSAPGEIGIPGKDCVPKVNAIDEVHGVEKHCGNSTLGGSSVTDTLGVEDAKLKCIIGDNGLDQTGEEHGERIESIGARRKNDRNGNVGVGEKSGLMEFLDVLKLVVRTLDKEANDEIEKEDFLEVAKKRGITFPRPRWWPPER